MRFQMRLKERLLVAQLLIPIFLLISIVGYARLGFHCLEHMASHDQCDAARRKIVLGWICLLFFSVILFFSIYFSERFSKIEDVYNMMDLAKGLQRDLVQEIFARDKYLEPMELFQTLLSTSWFNECCTLYMRIPNDQVDPEEKKKVLDLYQEVLAGVRYEIETRSLKELRETGRVGFEPIVQAAKDLGDKLAEICNSRRMEQPSPGGRLSDEGAIITDAIDKFCVRLTEDDGASRGNNRIRRQMRRAVGLEDAIEDGNAAAAITQ